MTEQEKREKVIKGLECCAAMSGDECKECPYSKECLDEDLPYGMPHLAADALNILKEHEPRVMTLNEMAFYDSGLYVETHNGCPEGLTDELWSALIHLYCVSQNGESGYVSFINWNADVYDFDAKGYNVDFRCWTSRPTAAQREAIPWE